jgi:hypothetical protein
MAQNTVFAQLRAELRAVLASTLCPPKRLNSAHPFGAVGF